MDSETTDSAEQASKEIAKKLTVSVITVVLARRSTWFSSVCVHTSSQPESPPPSGPSKREKVYAQDLGVSV